MPEEIELLAAGAVAAPLLNKMLGPTAEYIGNGARDLAAKAAGNVNTVLGKSIRRLGDGIEQPGGVPPKVLKSVWDEAQLAEDELTQDYLAGVLASSRSENGRDDRAAAHVRLIGDLSTYALRTHYLLYASAQRIYVGEDARDIRIGKFVHAHLFVRLDQYVAGMAFSEAEAGGLGGIMMDTLHTLHRRGLIDSFAYGDPSHLRTQVPGRDFPSTGILYKLTQFGVLLLTVACGVRLDAPDAWVSEPARFGLEAGPSLPTAVSALTLPVWVDPESKAPESGRPPERNALGS